MNDERDDRLRELLGELREDHRAPPELKRNVMERVRAIPDPLWKRALDWVLRPRTIQVTPATAGFAMAGLALLFVLRPGPQSTPSPSTGSSDAAVTTAQAGANTGARERSMTRFVFVAPEASEVRMTGDFVSWDPEGITLEDERGTGVWTADVPLSPGVYQYTFIVDGTEWRPDPHAVSQVDDGFGQQNSVVIVSGNNEA
ncbi:MAG: glycogen-binding domain-containing protein [Gemmatimonadota bacterium]|nr:glycogen-binding domain-containing protein [Gemmatimonadota bacterium]